MITVQPTILEGGGIRLEPLTADHHDALEAAAADGALWELWFTAVPFPGGMQKYIADALIGQRDGHMLPWIVRDLSSSALIGTTRYHDIMPAIDRVEIGHTWYAQSRQRTHVNTTCKLLLLRHAFDTRSAARSWDCGPTTSISARSGRSRGWGEEGRSDPPFRRAQGRHSARCVDVQHPRRGVARRPASPGAASRATPAEVMVVMAGWLMADGIWLMDRCDMTRHLSYAISHQPSAIRHVAVCPPPSTSLKSPSRTM